MDDDVIEYAGLIKQLEIFDRGPGRVEPGAWQRLQERGWLSVTGGLSDAGRIALYRHYRVRVILLEHERMDARTALRRAVNALRKAGRGRASGLLTKRMVKAALDEEFAR